MFPPQKDRVGWLCSVFCFLSLSFLSFFFFVAIQVSVTVLQKAIPMKLRVTHIPDDFANFGIKCMVTVLRFGGGGFQTMS